MSEQLLLNFQLNLYKNIVQDDNLSFQKENIYNFIPQEPKFPFIYIGNYFTSDWSNKTMFGLKIKFSIIIFSKSQTIKEIVQLSDCLLKITNNIILEINNINKKYIASIKLIDTSLEQTKKRQIYKNLLRFQANLEEVQ